VIAAFAPGTVSNVGPGFDILGFALDEPGDVVSAEAREAAGVEIVAIEGDAGQLSHDPRRNTAGAAVQALLSRLGTVRGVRLRIYKGLPLASGIGSSGASAVAALVATNEVLGRPASFDLLLDCAMTGEIAGCGSAHPDNVAPALYGGFVLARTSRPSDLVHLPVPDGLSCAVLHPHVMIETGSARRLLGESVPLTSAVRQWGNVGALVAGLFRNDLPLISRALEDHIAEPRRAHLVPALDHVKQAAVTSGALGCGLSGSGPSIFALCESLDSAQAAGRAMRAAFAGASDVPLDLWVSPVGARGARIVTT
jgi:homoserine kinase